jgi:hypothetical protein
LSHLETIDENADDIVWQYKENEARHRYDRSTSMDSARVGMDAHLPSLNKKNRDSLDSASVVSDLYSTNGVSVASRGGSGCSKMSQYVQSIIDKAKEHISESERQFISELNTYATYPDEVSSSSIRKSFFDPEADVHTSINDIFSVDCHTKVAAKKKNLKELFFLRDCLSSSAGSNGSGSGEATPASSESASTLTMTTPPPSRRLQGQDQGSAHPLRAADPPMSLQQQLSMRDQAELYHVAEALRFRLYLSGGFVSAPAVHM